MITLNRQPGQRVLELGGGANPLVNPACMNKGGVDCNVDARMCHNAAGEQTVDFVADFNQPLPIKDGDFDHVFSHFCLEHLSFHKVKDLLREVYRVLKWQGQAVFTVPNTEAQIQWILGNPSGWDGKDLFFAASELLYGSQDYPENSHKCYFSPAIIHSLFREVGFTNVSVQPYGERNTDMCVAATKGGNPVSVRPIQGEASAVDERKSAVIHTSNAPLQLGPTLENFARMQNAMQQTMVDSVMGIVMSEGEQKGQPVTLANMPLASPAQEQLASEAKQALKDDGARTKPQMSREEMFDRHYFNGGGKVGGYAKEGYRDFPIHEVTFRHILKRRPKSVLEIGAARGYVVKRFQDYGIRACGLEISRHCWMTRACNGIIEFDICKTPWPWKDDEFDLCYSIATLEHIPEEHLPAILREMDRVSTGGLHGIDFGEHDDGFDKTHCTLKDKSWWEEMFRKNTIGGYPVEIVNKEELESGPFPQEVLQGDGKLKLNVGSFITMHHNGWINIDQHDLMDYANHQGYKYMKTDVRNGLPFKTGEVDLISTNHFLEHLTYDEGLRFLRECRRVLKPDTGAMRIVVPDAFLLNAMYINYDNKRDLSYFDEISDGCAAAKTQAKKLWALLHEGHNSCYDSDTLHEALTDSGFVCSQTRFRERAFNRTGHDQIIKETIEMQPELSLIMEAIPNVNA